MLHTAHIQSIILAMHRDQETAQNKRGWVLICSAVVLRLPESGRVGAREARCRSSCTSAACIADIATPHLGCLPVCRSAACLTGTARLLLPLGRPGQHQLQATIRLQMCSLSESSCYTLILDCHH